MVKTESMRVKLNQSISGYVKVYNYNNLPSSPLREMSETDTIPEAMISCDVIRSL